MRVEEIVEVNTNAMLSAWHTISIQSKFITTAMSITIIFNQEEHTGWCGSAQEGV